MTPLLPLIIDEIDSQGPIGFDRYMELCLCHPEHGYYTSGDPLGRDGDFITAPEISQMFGELIGLWLHDQASRQNLDRPALAELGPGRGTLMADALRALSAASATPGGVHLVEISPALRERQRATLNQSNPENTAGNTADSITWHDAITTLPEEPLLIIANEFFDALPVRRFVARGQHWHEIRVGHDNGQLIEIIDAAPAEPFPRLPSQVDTQSGNVKRLEFCPAAPMIADALASHVNRHGGVALIIDYGSAGQAGDTLQSVRQHQRHDALEAPGQADLTAWVDFSIFTRAAQDHGLVAAGPVEQGDFLRSVGLYQRAENLARNADPIQRRRLLAAVERLSGSAHMGSAFKVMALLPGGVTLPIAGF